MSERRPPVRIRFRFNVDTGEIEQLIVDDQAPDRSERYHDQVAAVVGGYLGRRPRIEDAGPRHLLDEERRETAPQETTKEPAKETAKDAETE